ncbi:hypothetical protein Dimus_009237 [Dionaea muscipula]
MEAEDHDRAAVFRTSSAAVAHHDDDDDEDNAGPSTSSQSYDLEVPPPAAEEAEAEPELHVQQENEGQSSNLHSHHHSPRHHDHQQPPPPSSVSYRFDVSVFDMAPADMSDDVWSCLVVLVTFWFFASMTLILGFYGSEDLQLGPNCSRLITTNPIFVRSIKGQLKDPVSGPMLYGFHKSPPLDVQTTWSETHSASVLANYHQEWVYYLNTGSYVQISYDVQSPSYASVSLVIAQGPENLVEWMEDPSYPNTTLSWNKIHGSGKVEQEITSSATYYIAVGNLNPEMVKVELNFTINALLYNTTRASFKCSLSDHACTFDVFLLDENVAVLSSPGPEQAKDADGWYVKISYGPRWAIYFIGSGIMVIIMIAVFRFCSMWQARREDGARYETIEAGQESRDPLLLSPKDDDDWGSSYDSVNSQDEEDLDERIQEEKQQQLQKKEGDSQAKSNPSSSLCVICYDAPRDCFFLPCGHCAACFTCGSKIAEEAGTCPICRRKMKKVRKIFSV